jgi:adenylyltransferase/sulfurtransferase
VQEFKKRLDAGEDLQVIDVREPHEYALVNIGAELIPLNSITQHTARISRDKPVVIHCKGGVRSARAIEALEALGFDNLINLKGGIMAYAKEIDDSLAIY